MRNTYRTIRKGAVVSHGGLLDQTKTVSPDMLKTDHGLNLYYVGTNCAPNERKAYRILAAKSSDGLKFEKLNHFVLPPKSEDLKYYSPKVLKFKELYFMYFGLGDACKYVIKVAISSNPTSFKESDTTVINLASHHSAAVHTPKIFLDQNQTMHCYYTGSNSGEKIYSKRYPQYDVGNNFQLFYTSSKDGFSFEKGEPIKISFPQAINIYGHNILYLKNKIYLVFTSFDGEINRLYLSCSEDKINFTNPEMILQPDYRQKEMGLYSSCLYPSSKSNIFNLLFGVRYFSNLWDIHLAELNLL